MAEPMRLSYPGPAYCVLRPSIRRARVRRNQQFHATGPLPPLNMGYCAAVTAVMTRVRFQSRPVRGDCRAVRHAAGPGERHKIARRNGRGNAGGRLRADARAAADRRPRGRAPLLSAAISPGGVNRPDCSGSITSACAPTGVVTTARPCASPSSTDIASPSVCEGRTRMSAAAHNALAAG